MPLSVAHSAGGGGLSNLLRQTRPARSGDETGPTASGEPASASARPLGRTTIDSTGSRTAAIKAALVAQVPTVSPGDAADKTATRAAAVAPSQRTGAADLLRLLDTYAADPLRLSA